MMKCECCKCFILFSRGPMKYTMYSRTQLDCPLLTYFRHGVFFSLLGTNTFKMIIDLPICTESKKKHSTKCDNENTSKEDNSIGFGSSNQSSFKQYIPVPVLVLGKRAGSQSTVPKKNRTSNGLEHGSWSPKRATGCHWARQLA